ncbi:hypothetical protein AB0J80_10230 [Actinoplanes sp. NPDC049548]|uniref:hypothetical protein n=1 Tax=Actinoplanes sp. NPDC049548 TaxID=3155152 RepID=UPI0034428244
MASLWTRNDEPDDRPFWQQRGWQLSAAFLAVVLCAGLVAVLLGGPGDADADRRALSGPLIGQLGPDGSRPGGCRTDDSDQDAPTRPPRDVTWRTLNGARVPLSRSAGPLLTAGPLLWCFAHTPMGAVMAAHVIPRHMSGEDWRTATQQQVVAGPARDIFEAMRSSLQQTKPQHTAIALAGFMVMTYSPELATVRLLLRQGDTVYAYTDYTVAWDGVDWKLRPLSTGDLHTRVTAAKAGDGFVMWGV